MEKLALSSHYTYKNIARQCLSPVLMMIFCSLYVIVDGLFISNIVGPDALAGVNLIFPLIMIVGGLGFMFGSGGSALASKLLGEKNNKEANRVFTMMIEAAFVFVLIVSIIVFFFIDKIAYALASLSQTSTQGMIDAAILYGRILILAQPLFAVQNLFQNFFVVDEKPKMGFIETLAAGITNIVFDAILIAGCNLGVVGAAIGTILGYAVGTAVSILYFLIKKDNLLQITPCKFNWAILSKTMTNGASDFIYNISSSIIGIIFNIQLLKYIGQDGINAYGIIMYISFIFFAIFIGIAIGMGPIIGYNYGAQNKDELYSVTKKLLRIYTVISVIMIVLCEALSYPLSCMFTRDEALVNLTCQALRIYSLCYIFSGLSILIITIFTSLNNGLISGILSLLRSLVFHIIFVFILPLIMGQDGIWWSIVFAEVASCIVCFYFFLNNKKKYLS